MSENKSTRVGVIGCGNQGRLALMRELMKDTEIVIVNPESEYKSLVESLGLNAKTNINLHDINQ